MRISIAVTATISVFGLVLTYSPPPATAVPNAISGQAGSPGHTTSGGNPSIDLGVTQDEGDIGLIQDEADIEATQDKGRNRGVTQDEGEGIATNELQMMPRSSPKQLWWPRGSLRTGPTSFLPTSFLRPPRFGQTTPSPRRGVPADSLPID